MLAESMSSWPQIGVLVGAWVAVAVGDPPGQPFSALFTAVRISSIVIWPLWLASPAVHVATPALPRAMFTMVSSSSTVTERSLWQSPGHLGAGVAVGVSVGVPVGVRVGVAVSVDVALVQVAVAVGVGV
jgi:hypothetical protein